MAPAEKEKNARIKRGPGIEVKKIQDKKLKGKVKYTERVFLEAQQKTIKINDWLLPTEGGLLEADGELGKELADGFHSPKVTAHRKGRVYFVLALHIKNAASLLGS